ncbi:unnamed protein product [Amoebophrya sp. A25]|nr:unnamed protein product [Amoebophrya sp. A25]|eukprot:GSA25T00024881001.1
MQLLLLPMDTAITEERSGFEDFIADPRGSFRGSVARGYTRTAVPYHANFSEIFLDLALERQRDSQYNFSFQHEPDRYLERGHAPATPACAPAM